MEMTPEMIAVISASAGASAAGIWKAARWLIQRRDRISKERKEEKSSDQIPKVLEGFVRIEEMLDSLQTKLQCARVVLLRVEDSGSVPEQGQDLYSSVYAASGAGQLITDPQHPGYEQQVARNVRRRWRDQLIDSNYHGLLRKVVEKKFIYTSLFMGDAETYHIDPESDLGVFYRRENVVGGMVAEVYRTPRRYFYLSCIYQLEAEPSKSLAMRDTMRAYVNALRNVFRESSIAAMDGGEA